jgi:hypothetical protein
MDRVSHSKCKLCQKVLNVSKLKDNDHGIGKVCIDNEACKKRVAKNKENK